MKPILTLIIKNGRGDTIAELALDDRQAAAPSVRNTPRDQPQQERADDYGVTEPQRRLLFRLAARLGFEGDTAREYIDRRLGPDPDKRAASQLIDDLQEELKRTNGGRHERAS